MRRTRLSFLPAVLAATLLLAGCGGGGGGDDDDDGSNGTARSKTFRFEVTAVGLRDTDTGDPVAANGLPLASATAALSD